MTNLDEWQKMKLEELVLKAESFDAIIVEECGFWLLNLDGSGVWPDGNFSTSLEELEAKVNQLMEERQ